jgi:hypothetical protein
MPAADRAGTGRNKDRSDTWHDVKEWDDHRVHLWIMRVPPSGRNAGFRAPDDIPVDGNRGRSQRQPDIHLRGEPEFPQSLNAMRNQRTVTDRPVDLSAVEGLGLRNADETASPAGGQNP